MSYEDIYNYSVEKIELSDIRHPDMTLEELQTMTRKKAIRLFRRWPTKDVIARNQLLMSIIMAASRIKWSTDDPRGIREFWYNPCKPIFLRVYGKEIDDLSEENIDSICDQLSHILSVMRKSHLIKYEDLGIKDFRTLRMLWEHEDRADCWSNVLLFVEKDAAYIHLRPLKKLLNISLLSGGGVSKTAANEDLMNILPQGKYTIFTFTDYDPWGFFISGEAYMKLKQMGWDLNVIRLGLDTKQVSKEIIAHQKYPVKMDHNGQVWSPKYGILGRLRTVFRTRKTTIKDPETGKKKKVEEQYLAYEGRKGWGLEIEAVSGQQGGAQHLREIVLAALLKKEYEELSTGDKKAIWKRLKEEDRLDEIKTPLWEEIGWDKDTNPFSEEEWENYEEHGLADFDDFITEEKYDELKEGRDSVWEADRKPVTDRVEWVTEEESSLTVINRDLRQDIASITETMVEVATIHLKEQIEELREKIRGITQKIEDTGCVDEKTSLNWLRFTQQNLKLVIRKNYDDLETIDDPYNEDIEELKEQKAICDAIRVTVYVEWFNAERDHLFEGQTNEEEEISFGLMPGVHLEVLKEGGDISDLFSKVEEFDTNRIYKHIWKVSQNEERDAILERLADKLELYGDEDREWEWHEKWDQYQEVN